MQSDQFISLAEAARLLNERGARVTYWNLWKGSNAGTVPTVRIAGRILMNRADLPKVEREFAPVDQ